MAKFELLVGERTAFTRQLILERLRATIASGRPIIGAGSSAGIIAKSAEAGGADLIVCYSTGKSRLMGLPTTKIGHSNVATMEMFDELANVVDDTPIIGGVEPTDPTFRRLPELLRAFQRTGFDGVINFPSVGPRPEYAARREHTGQGLRQEFRFMELAREAEYFTMGYAYHVDQARGLAQAGVDVMVPHAGWTTGGSLGADAEVGSLEGAAEHVQRIIEASVAENPDVICLAHGGSIAEPEDTLYLYEHTDAVGFVGASTIERTPVERAVKATVEALKNVPVPTERKPIVTPDDREYTAM